MLLQPLLELALLLELQRLLEQPSSSAAYFVEELEPGPEQQEQQQLQQAEHQAKQLQVVLQPVSVPAWPPAGPSVPPSAGGRRPELQVGLLHPLPLLWALP